MRKYEQDAYMTKDLYPEYKGLINNSIEEYAKRLLTNKIIQMANKHWKCGQRCINQGNTN